MSKRFYSVFTLASRRSSMGIKALALFIVLLALSACSRIGPGLIYTNIIRPYSRDFTNTAAGSKRVVLDEYSLREPVSGFGLSVEWSKDRLRSEAQKVGMTHISHVEQQMISVLLGIYSKRSLIIYGD